MLDELTAGEAGLLALLFPHLAGLELRQVEHLGDGARIVARTRTASLACRGCGVVSAQVHDRYRRRLQDLACAGRPVQVVLEVCRFCCGSPQCPVATFAGQVTVLGVDDIAKRKGHSYATVLMDMDSHRLIDMLPDREAETFRAWLRERSGIEVICRDRAGAYARAARDAAPAGVQVADRFHLWQNLAEAVEKPVLAVLAMTPASGPQTAEAAPSRDGPALAPGPPAVPDGFRDVHGHERRLAARHRERYAAVQALRAEGCSVREIARRLELARGTAARFANAASIDELLVKATSRPTILDPFKPYPGQRWNGVTSAAALHEEIRARGWAGGILAVERYLRQFRTADGRDRQARTRPQLTAPAAPPPPKPRQVTR